MSRSISLSTDVYAAIWAERQAGEETEDDILRRKFGCGESEPLPPSASVTSKIGGVHDRRNNVHFPEGFEVFRNYKGKQFRATARNGAWHRQDNSQAYPTLNQVNASIAAGAENIWNGNWKYLNERGQVRSINDLRTD